MARKTEVDKFMESALRLIKGIRVIQDSMKQELDELRSRVNCIEYEQLMEQQRKVKKKGKLN